MILAENGYISATFNSQSQFKNQKQTNDKQPKPYQETRTKEEVQ